MAMPTLARNVLSGTLDPAVCPLPEGEVSDGLVFDGMLEGRNVIACRIGHPLARRRTLRLSDTVPYPWIAPPRPSPLYHDLTAILREIEVDDFKVSFSGGSISSVRTVLEGSDSLTILPYSVLFMLRQHKSLTALDIHIRHTPRNLAFRVRRTGSNRPLCGGFASTLHFTQKHWPARSPMPCKVRSGGSETGRGAHLGQDRPDHHQIGPLVQRLIQAEGAPVPGLIRAKPGMVRPSPLGPIDVEMHCPFNSAHNKGKAGRHAHQHQREQ